MTAVKRITIRQDLNRTSRKRRTEEPVEERERLQSSSFRAGAAITVVKSRKAGNGSTSC